MSQTPSEWLCDKPGTREASASKKSETYLFLHFFKAFPNKFEIVSTNSLASQVECVPGTIKINADMQSKLELFSSILSNAGQLVFSRNQFFWNILACLDSGDVAKLNRAEYIK